MFTYIKCKNFLSLGDVVFDFKKNQNSINPIVIVYGENGSGKTNFVQAFSVLKNTIHSFEYQRHADELLSIFKEEVFSVANIQQELSIYQDFCSYLSSKRMVDCDEPTELEYGFVMNDKEAIYHISFTDRIIEESLYGFTGKQRGYLFKISSDDNNTINSKLQSGLIIQSLYKKEMNEKISQYWGKHTFLSIINKQKMEKNEKFIEENISMFLLESLKQLDMISITNKLPHSNENRIIYNDKNCILWNLENGVIKADQVKTIERTERIIREFLTQTYSDIKDVQYGIAQMENDKVHYQLYVDKMINGKVRRISFAQESAGTHQVIDILRSLIGLFCGVTVVYDEIDNGVHDILLTGIIKSLQDEITGQLIITTHNTMLLEEMDEHYVYVISTDYLGRKSVHCAAEYGIQTNHNLRTRYLKGLLGGVPYADGVDYDEIENILAERGIYDVSIKTGTKSLNVHL